MANKNPHNYPTVEIDLPSKGLPYPTDNPASKGKIEMMYPGAAQSDILTNGNYLAKGLAVKKYMESIVLSDINIDDLIPGDRDAVMINSHIVGFGKEYITTVTLDRGPEPVSFDISTFKERDVNWDLFTQGVNEFEYVTGRKDVVKFKLLSGVDEEKMAQEEEGMKKINPNFSGGNSLFLKYCLIEVNGKRDSKSIRDFVDKKLLQLDITDLTEYIVSVSPGYVWEASGTRQNGEVVEGLSVPYTTNFFWPSIKKFKPVLG